MNIDTLFLSGCGTKGTTFIGAFRALIEKNIIDFKQICRYVCCSGSSIIGVLLCCGYNLNFICNLSNKLDYSKLLNLDDLDDIFSNKGLFSNNNIGKLIDNIIQKKYKKNDTTLKQFYDLTKIHFVCKVYNLSDKCNEYFSYENHPNMKVSTLVQMTTCIPLFFKPIKYNDKYYIDGGVLCIMPFIEKYKNYLGIYIKENKDSNIENMDAFEYITYINSCLTHKCKLNINKQNESKIIQIHTKLLPCINFDVCKNDKNILKQSGYDETILHIDKFELFNQKKIVDKS